MNLMSDSNLICVIVLTGSIPVWDSVLTACTANIKTFNYNIRVVELGLQLCHSSL